MNKTKRMSNQIFILVTSVAIWIVAFCPGFANGQTASVSVSGGPWAIGAVVSGQISDTTGNTWTITGSNNAIEDIDINVSSTGLWSAWTTADNSNTTNYFVLREDNSIGLQIQSIDVRLIENLARAGTYGLDLWFKAPPTGSEEGLHTLTVTLTAKNPEVSCDGWYYQGSCWYEASAVSVNCSTLCADHGGCIAGAEDQAKWLAVCQHYHPGWTQVSGNQYNQAPFAWISGEKCHTNSAFDYNHCTWSRADAYKICECAY